jgi:hypothetical protein
MSSKPRLIDGLIRVAIHEHVEREREQAKAAGSVTTTSRPSPRSPR